MTNLSDTTRDACHENCSNCHAGEMPCLGDLIFMEPEQRIEQYRAWKKEAGYSNIHIAEESGVSEVSVSRFFAGQTKDTKVSTLFDILRVILKARYYNCQNRNTQDISRAQTDNTDDIKSRMHEQHEADRRIIDYLKTEIEKRDAQIRTKDKHLEQRADFIYRKDRVITILSVLLGVSVLLILSALVVDVINPNIGFFWVEHMAALTGLG